MKHMKIPRACGSWPSPITAVMCADRPEGPLTSPMFELSSDGESVYWLSARPNELGRNALMKWTPDKPPQQLLDAPWNVRSGVNEYGGGAYCVAGGAVYFSHFSDGRLYRLLPGGVPTPLTPPGAYRFAEPIVDVSRNRLICVREDFSQIGNRRSEAATELTAVDLSSGAVAVLASGFDFYSSPRLSPDGSQVSWLSRTHPNMPWDVTTLHRACFLEDGSPHGIQSEATTSPQARMQPCWSEDGELYYLSDPDGWWNLFHWPTGSAKARQITHLKAEIGGPAWMLGNHHWAMTGPHTAVILFTHNGYWHAADVDTRTGAILRQTPPHALLTSVTVAGGRIFVSGADTRGNCGLYQYAEGQLSLHVAIDHIGYFDQLGEVSVATPMTIPLPVTGETRAGEVAYAWFYPPANSNYCPLTTEKPPVIVQFHGGPTTASHSSFSLQRQFWTSRGFAIIDVNYRGSTGRGRAYRHRLYGGYGILDVEDAVAAVRDAEQQGLIDGKRAAISGASSGGFTTLAALAFHDTFSAGINFFGVSDLKTLTETTHKFESRYIESLVGDCTHDAGLLERRSPIRCLGRIRAPLMTLQGSRDKIVPPEQSRVLMDAVRSKGLPCAYLEFEDEGHGFRRKETLVRAMEASLSFYGQVLGFEPADNIQLVEMDNRDMIGTGE